jgi:hypothetical protein
LKRAWIALLFVVGSPLLSQAAKPISSKSTDEKIAEEIPASALPVRSVEFAAVDTGAKMPLSPATTLPPLCNSDGTLFLDTLEVKGVQYLHTVISIRGKETHQYSPAGISDLHDVFIHSFYPSDSIVGFLVRATKEPLGKPGPGKSPAGVPWDKYHNYIAEFDLNGSYKESIELPMDYQVSHLAILPSGEFLVSGYDRLNSTAKLVFLNSSGQLVRNLDLPAARSDKSGDAAFGSAKATMVSSRLIGLVVFTGYKSDILVWHMGSKDPILDVGPSGSVREVPVELPPDSVFLDMIPAADRWVAHFRSKNVAEGAPLNQTDYSYYELRPQDASLSAKLIQTGDIPLSLACESDGKYIAFKRDKDNNLVLLSSN